MLKKERKLGYKIVCFLINYFQCFISQQSFAIVGSLSHVAVPGYCDSRD